MKYKMSSFFLNFDNEIRCFIIFFYNIIKLLNVGNFYDFDFFRDAAMGRVGTVTRVEWGG